MHPRGEALLDDVQLLRNENTVRARREQLQKLGLREHVNDIPAVDRVRQLLHEQPLRHLLVSVQPQIILAGKDLRVQLVAQRIREGAFARTAFAEDRNYHIAAPYFSFFFCAKSTIATANRPTAHTQTIQRLPGMSENLPSTAARAASTAFANGRT